MNGISQFMYGIILIHLAGMTAYLSWKKLYPFLRKNASNLIYITLRQVCVLCLTPVGYVLVMLLRRNGYIQGDDWWRMNFRVTGTIGSVLVVLWLFWMIRTVYVAVTELKDCLPQKEEKKPERLPEKEGIAFDEFQAAKKDMKIHGFVGLYRDKGIHSPKTTGAVFARVLLPYLCDCEYSEEQLRVTYYHELTHYRSGDVFYKILSLLAGLLCIFRIFTIERNAMLTEWSERNCDIGAIAALKGKMTGGEYFRTIIGMVEQRSALFGEDGHTASMLIDDSSRLKRRIDYVQHYKETTKMPKWWMALFLASFLTANVASAFLMGSLLAELNDMLYKATETIRIEETNQSDFGEMFLDGTSDNTYTGIERSENKPVRQSLDEDRTMKEVWDIASGIRYVSGKISLKQGQEIKISCIAVPNTETTWIGLMNDNDRDILYVEGMESIRYIFTVPQDGDYCVFVQNRGSQDIIAQVSCQYE